jgi:hypothetical protein
MEIIQSVLAPWSEWDIGVNDNLYSTKEKAWEAIRESFDEDELGPLDEAIESGLIGVSERNVL